MPQKEYGSARWGGPEDIAPFLDEDAQNNLPLTASESLSLSPKMKVTANDNYNRNKNVIVFGPSGSGKSYSVAGPQLLQFNSNYVLSDPKGVASGIWQCPTLSRIQSESVQPERPG